MRKLRIVGALFTLGILLGAQQVFPDPVMKARAERAKAQGIPEGDLPPVPKAIIEPPPLPPPESHVRDTRRSRRSRRSTKKSKGQKTVQSAKTAPKKGNTRK
jgi:hypothetical protein